MNVSEFLKLHKQSPDDIDIITATQSFIAEMELGLKGEGSLKMFPTYLGGYNPGFTSNTDKFIVMDAGGTNFRSALCYFDEGGGAVVENLQKTAMPASDSPLCAEDFYDGIAKNVERLLPHGGDIGFCFSYPVDMEADLDGRVASTPKELKAQQITGTKVGECTLRAIKKYNSVSRKIVILNDTVATLLGGMAQTCGVFAAYIGYIYGTGTNIAYMEAPKKIEKLKNTASGEKMIINTECGNYNKFPFGDFDLAVALTTSDPGRQMFEKATSGKYLARVMHTALQAASDEGVFKKSMSVPKFSLPEVTEFLGGKKGILGGVFTQTDADAAVEILTALIDRAARMGAVANGAAAIKSDVPAGKTVAIVAEGTTFYKLYGYRERFERYLTAILSGNGIVYKIIGGEELNLTGALAAASARRP